MAGKEEFELIGKMQKIKDELKTKSAVSNPVEFSRLKFDLGQFYVGLAKMRNSKADLASAAEAYGEAARAYPVDKFPEEFARAQNVLGLTLKALSHFSGYPENRKNLEKANHAFKEALKVMTADKYPEKHAAIQSNLGDSISELAEICDSCSVVTVSRAVDASKMPDVTVERSVKQSVKAKFFGEAVSAYLEALKIYNKEKNPEEYARVKYSLGKTYLYLSYLENAGENSSKAVEACLEALKIYDAGKYPENYANLNNILGAAYGLLSDTAAGPAGKARILKLSIDAFQASLKIWDAEKYTVKYARVMNNIGNTCTRLAETGDKKEMKANLTRALEFFDKAIKVLIPSQAPMDYAMLLKNIAMASMKLADFEKKEKNLTTAIDSLKMALEVCTNANFPAEYGILQENLGDAYLALADASDKKSNLEEAVQAYIRANSSSASAKMGVAEGKLKEK